MENFQRLNLFFKQEWESEHRQCEDLGDYLPPQTQWYLNDAASGVNIYLNKEYSDPNQTSFRSMISILIAN